MKELAPYKLALAVWKKENVLSYALPDKEIVRALHVGTHLWQDGTSQVATDIVSTQCLIEAQREKQKDAVSSGEYRSAEEIAYEKSIKEDWERSLALDILKITQLRINEEVAVSIRDARRYGTSQNRHAILGNQRRIWQL